MQELQELVRGVEVAVNRAVECIVEFYQHREATDVVSTRVTSAYTPMQARAETTSLRCLLQVCEEASTRELATQPLEEDDDIEFLTNQPPAKRMKWSWSQYGLKEGDVILLAKPSENGPRRFVYDTLKHRIRCTVTGTNHMYFYHRQSPEAAWERSRGTMSMSYLSMVLYGAPCQLHGPSLWRLENTSESLWERRLAMEERMRHALFERLGVRGVCSSIL
jgi:hypothetical protein